jgi:hypothetical protein
MCEVVDRRKNAKCARHTHTRTTSASVKAARAKSTKWAGFAQRKECAVANQLGTHAGKERARAGGGEQSRMRHNGTIDYLSNLTRRTRSAGALACLGLCCPPGVGSGWLRLDEALRPKRGPPSKSRETKR